MQIERGRGPEDANVLPPECIPTCRTNELDNSKRKVGDSHREEKGRKDREKGERRKASSGKSDWMSRIRFPFLTAVTCRTLPGGT